MYAISRTSFFVQLLTMDNSVGSEESIFFLNKLNLQKNITFPQKQAQV